MALALALALFPAASGCSQETRLKAREQIVFYPGIAQRVPHATNLWNFEIRGCVFEWEKRPVLSFAFREAFELKAGSMSAEESLVFGKRARLFLVDHKRGRKVYVRVGTNVCFAGKSIASGRFTASLELPLAKAQAATDPHSPTHPIPFTVIVPSNDSRVFQGEIFPLEEQGVSVISDLDDTIKITQVRDKKALLRNTMLTEFQPVPGMAMFYQTLAQTHHADFHYISASPWQLYEPLSAFVASNGFPAGTFELKQFRWTDRSFFSLFADPVKYKTNLMVPLLKRFPHRKFILVGDSGERDPEIYGGLARQFPGQVIGIYIRDVTEEPRESERYRQAFEGISAQAWQIFCKPEEIKIPPE